MSRRKHKQKNNPPAPIPPRPLTPIMLTPKEAAALVKGLPKSRIRKMCVDGTLPHMRAGKKYLINQTALLVAIGEIVR